MKLQSFLPLRTCGGQLFRAPALALLAGMLWQGQGEALAQARGQYVIPAIRNGNGTRFTYWNLFTLPPGVQYSYNIPHYPNVLADVPDDDGNFSNYNEGVELVQVGSTRAFITSGKAIYDWGTITSFVVNYTNTGTEPVNNVIFQTQTAGTRFDIDQIRLRYTPAGGGEPVDLAPDFKALDDPGTGGFAERLMSAFQWDLTGLGVGDFQLRFTAPDFSMAFYEAQLDTVPGAAFVQELGYLVTGGVLPVGPASGGWEVLRSYALRYQAPGEVSLLLGPDEERRFFLPGKELEFEAQAYTGFQHVGWVDLQGGVVEGTDNLSVTVGEGDQRVHAVFSPETWEIFRKHFFNHVNNAMGMTADDYMLDAVSAPEVDHDKDGLTNFQEYAFGGSPYLADAADLAPAGSVVTVEGQVYPALTFRRQAAEGGDLEWSVEESDDMVSWRSNSPETTVTVPVTSLLNRNGTRTVTMRSATPVTEGRRFLRVKAAMLVPAETGE